MNFVENPPVGAHIVMPGQIDVASTAGGDTDLYPESIYFVLPNSVPQDATCWALVASDTVVSSSEQSITANGRRAYFWVRVLARMSQSTHPGSPVGTLSSSGTYAFLPAYYTYFSGNWVLTPSNDTVWASPAIVYYPIDRVLGYAWMENVCR